MSQTPEILWPALRQYRHNNDNSPSLSHPEGGFVAAFDYDETLKVVTAMQEEIAALKAELARAREALIDEWAWNHAISCEEQGHSVGVDDARVSAQGQYEREIAKVDA